MNASMTRAFLLPLCAAVAAVCAAGVASAEEQALVQGPRISITEADIQADSLRMPVEMRSIVLARPQTVMQIATNLYARRAMAESADAQKLAQDPEVQAALRIARDKVLSDAYLAKLDKAHTPSAAAAEGLARNVYKAKPERFQAQEEVRARHILIAGEGDEQRAQAQKLLEEIKTGGDFAKLAREHSTDKGSAAKGGDLGFFGKGRMVPEFETAVFSLKNPGDLSGVVQSKFGYHIIQLQDRRPAGIRPYEEVREALIKEVRDAAIQEARVEEAQKMQLGVKINEEAIKAVAARYDALPKPAPTPVGK